MSNFNFLGINSESNLNIDLINKLKTAETSSRLKPEESKLDFLNNEKDVLNNIKTKTNDLLQAVSFLRKDSSVSAFNNLTANVNGTSAIVTSNNSNLEETSFDIKVNKLAQKDVYQSILIDNKDSIITTNDEFINVNGNNISLKDKTFEQLKTELNDLVGVNSSLEKVNRNQYRLVIKSEQEGTNGAITINSDNSLIGFSTFGNHLLTAQNSDIDVEGVNYNLSSNKITLENGVEITAHNEGVTNVKISKDNSLIPETVENLITKYNDLNSYLNEKISKNEIQDKSSAREMMNQIKNHLFGTSNENNIFTIGVNMNKDGSLELDSTVFNNLMNKDLNRIKNIFTNDSRTGIADKLNDTLISFGQNNGIINLYEKRNENSLLMTNNEIIKINDTLNKKYNTLSNQFSEYNNVISKMNSSFEALSSMIQYSYSSNK